MAMTFSWLQCAIMLTLIAALLLQVAPVRSAPLPSATTEQEPPPAPSPSKSSKKKSNPPPAIDETVKVSSTLKIHNHYVHGFSITRQSIPLLESRYLGSSAGSLHVYDFINLAGITLLLNLPVLCRGRRLQCVLHQ